MSMENAMPKFEYTPREMLIVEQIREGINTSGGIMAALGPKGAGVTRDLTNMWNRKRITRTGEKGAYAYAELPGMAPEKAAFKRSPPTKERTAEGLGPETQKTIDAIRAGATTQKELSKVLGISESNVAARIVHLIKLKRVISEGRGSTRTFTPVTPEEFDILHEKTDDSHDLSRRLQKSLELIRAGIMAGHTNEISLAKHLGITVRSLSQSTKHLIAAGSLLCSKSPRGSKSKWRFALPDAPVAEPAVEPSVEPVAEPIVHEGRTAVYEAPAEGMTINVEPFIDGIMVALTPMIDQLTRTMAKPIARYVIASLQSNVADALAEAVKTMPTPQVNGQRKRKVVICGLLPSQAGMINAEFSNHLDFKFVPSDAVNKAALAGVQNADLCLMMTGFVSHSQVATVKSMGGEIEWSNGGMDQLRDRLRGFVEEA